MNEEVLTKKSTTMVDTVLRAEAFLVTAMKVNDPNFSPIVPAETTRSQRTQRVSSEQSSAAAAASGSAGADDVHLSELVRSLRALATESPERQAHLEAIARAYAAGTYQVDAEATAARIIDDAISK
jgi:flagellar biosynthesis anti-sigma factor FlgM